MNQEFIFILLLIGTGYFFKKIHILKEQDGEVISRIVFNITLPALIIISLNSVDIEPSLIMIPFLVILFGLITSLLAFFIFKNERKEFKGSMMMLSTGYNVGLFAFPLVEAIWGAKGLLYFGMFDVGNSFLVFGLSYILGSYYSEDSIRLKPKQILKKFSKSIPLMTYIIMSTLNFSGIHLPSFFIDFAAIISKANMPLSLLLLGLYLNFTFERQLARPTIKYLLYRYGAGTIGGLACYFLLPANQMVKYTMLIGFLLPIGLSVIPYAHEFKFKTTKLIGLIANLCIVISMLILFYIANFII